MMRPLVKTAAVFLTFVAVFFAVAISLNQRHPVLVIAGEDSPATWLSGALLIANATLSGTIAYREGWFPWIVLTAFFFLLAIDERFMIHETLKDHILHSRGKDVALWIKELPVMIGALTGLAVAVILFQKMNMTGKVLLSVAVLFGLISVVMDIFSLGVIPEEICKLVGEISLCIALFVRSQA